MINTKLLEDKIRESGIKKKFLAEKLGMSRQTLNASISNKTEFKVSHVPVICDVLGIEDHERDRIFFAHLGA